MAKNDTYSADLLHRNFEVSPSNQIPRVTAFVVLPLLCSVVFVQFSSFVKNRKRI
jgi:hypothetical protein